MKNMLVLSPTPSHPQDQGNRRRIFEVAKRYQEEGYTVHFVWFAMEWKGLTSQEALAEMQTEWDFFYIVPATRLRQSPENEDCDQAWTLPLADMINWLKQSFEFDIAWIHYVMFSKACELFGVETTCVVDTHDVLAEREALFHDLEQPSGFFSLSTNAEKQGLARADFVIACQPEDAKVFEQSYGLPDVFTIGQIQHETISRPSKVAKNTVGFIGSDNAVNRHSLELLLRALDEVEEYLPEGFCLKLAGTMTRASDLQLPHYVEDCGRVDDLDAFYDSVELVLLPIEFGTGLKVKAVEAVSYGKPVLATAHAVIGLEANHPYLSFATVKELAASLPNVLRNSPLLEELAEESKSLFRRYNLGTEEQWRLFEAAREKRRTNLERMHEFDPTRDELTRSTLIYGAGMGGRIVWQNLSEDARQHVCGFLDRAAPQDTLFKRPTMTFDQLQEEGMGEVTIIIALMTGDAVAVYQDFIAKGYVDVRSARQFLVRQMV